MDRSRAAVRNEETRQPTVSLNLGPVENRATPLPHDQVPTLVPQAIMNELTSGDAQPYYRVESIEYPAQGDNPAGYAPATYGERFFETFIAVMSKKPVPGSKRGHEFKSRPNSDFYTVGGKLAKNGNGAGVAHLKIYIPPKGDETGNEGFIRDNRAGIVQFSIAAAVEYSVNTQTREVTILAVKGGARNDAVPEGAMDQTVNTASAADEVLNAEGDKLLAASVRKARMLINDGKYSATKAWRYSAQVRSRMLGAGGADWANYKSWHLVEHTSAEENSQARFGYPYGDGSIVLRSALQATAARASGQGLTNVSRAASALVDLIREKDEAKSGRSLMDTKEEVLEFLKVNNGIPLEELAKTVGQESKLATKEHTDALAVVNGIKALGLKGDQVAEVKALQDQVAAGEKETVANRLTREFGAEKDAYGKDNALRSYAGRVITNTEKIEEQIENLKKDPVAQQLQSQRAAYNSEVNTIGAHEGGGAAPANDLQTVQTKNF